MSEEMCLFSGMQCKHMDSPAEVVLSPFIHQHKTESGNLQRWEHPSHKPFCSLQEPQDLLVQPHTNMKMQLQSAAVSSCREEICVVKCTYTHKKVYFF